MLSEDKVRDILFKLNMLGFEEEQQHNIIQYQEEQASFTPFYLYKWLEVLHLAFLLDFLWDKWGR